MPIGELGLTGNAYNALEDLGIDTVEELQRLEEDGLLNKKLKGKALKEVRKALNEL